MLTGEIQDFTPEDNADFYANPAGVDDRGIVANLLGPDGLPGARHTAGAKAPARSGVGQGWSQGRIHGCCAAQHRALDI